MLRKGNISHTSHRESHNQHHDGTLCKSIFHIFINIMFMINMDMLESIEIKFKTKVMLLYKVDSKLFSEVFIVFRKHNTYYVIASPSLTLRLTCLRSITVPLSNSLTFLSKTHQT